MCRGKQVCTLLGAEPSRWDRRSPLRPPAWTRESLNHFAEAVALAGAGEISGSAVALARTRGDELSEFFIEHAQIAGRMRLKAQQRRPERKPGAGSLKYDKALESAVYERDAYACRYCGGPVVTDSVLKAYSRLMGAAVFPVGATNLGRHGVLLAFRANVDHVDPRSRGGTNEMDNLVTSCWPCNFGKSSYALDELLLDDPRKFAPDGASEWRGLTEHLDSLRRGVLNSPAP